MTNLWYQFLRDKDKLSPTRIIWVYMWCLFPPASVFECKICLRSLGVERPVHDRWVHFACGWDDPDFEWIVDRRVDKEDGILFGMWLDDNYPWTLESGTEWCRRHGYEIVSMRKT